MIPKQNDDEIELFVHVQKLKLFFILHYNGYNQHINKEDFEWELAFWSILLFWPQDKNNFSYVTEVEQLPYTLEE